MAARKRTKRQILGDMAFIAKGLLDGKNHDQITWELNSQRPYSLDRSQITKDAGKIYQHWRDSYLTDISAVKARELAKLDAIESAAWDAWEKSKQDQTETTEIEIDDKMNGAQSYSRRKSQTKTEQRTGNVKFLETVERCISKRCEILGLFAGKSVTVNWRRQAALEGIDPDKLTDSLAEEFIRHAKANDGD